MMTSSISLFYDSFLSRWFISHQAGGMAIVLMNGNPRGDVNAFELLCSWRLWSLIVTTLNNATYRTNGTYRTIVHLLTTLTDLMDDTLWLPFTYTQNAIKNQVLKVSPGDSFANLSPAPLNPPHPLPCPLAFVREVRGQREKTGGKRVRKGARGERGGKGWGAREERGW